MSEPNVSVPMDTGENPAATATAEPDDEPPGFYNTIHQQLIYLQESKDTHAVSATRVILPKPASDVC